VPCPFPGCHSSTSATIDLNPPSMCSHNARVLRLVAANDAANTEQCPICWEEIDYEDLIALPCGHREYNNVGEREMSVRTSLPFPMSHVCIIQRSS
jgi:hypothetical protein